MCGGVRYARHETSGFGGRPLETGLLDDDRSCKLA